MSVEIKSLSYHYLALITQTLDVSDLEPEEPDLPFFFFFESIFYFFWGVALWGKLEKRGGYRYGGVLYGGGGWGK